jgi:uncharacterized protein involved in type VI secretion and phage assembly
VSTADNLLDLVSTEEEELTKATRINGIVVGTVTSNKDENNLAMIKVTFPWHSDENETDWIRICNIMGGNDRGCVFVPEVGDEVVCAFIHGDINRPICLGALHSLEDKPPAKTDDGENNTKILKTRTGHSIVFNDKDLKESITVTSKSGHKIILDDTLGKQNIKITDMTNKNLIEIDSISNSITLSSALSLKLKAVNIDIEATGLMNIKANTLLTIKGLPVKIN